MMRQNMSKPVEPKLSPQAWRIFKTVVTALGIENTNRVFIADVVLVRRSRIQHREVSSALTELTTVDLLRTKQSRRGCEYWLPPLITV
jgi:hypothetical protein